MPREFRRACIRIGVRDAPCALDRPRAGGVRCAATPVEPRKLQPRMDLGLTSGGKGCRRRVVTGPHRSHRAVRPLRVECREMTAGHPPHSSTATTSRCPDRGSAYTHRMSTRPVRVVRRCSCGVMRSIRAWMSAYHASGIRRDTARAPGPWRRHVSAVLMPRPHSRDPLAPAQPSERARYKKAGRCTDDGWPPFTAWTP